MNLDNWKPNHDPRSRAYPIRAEIPQTALTVGTPVRPRMTWPTGPVLNQGADGACVGYAFTGALAAEPVDLWPAADPGQFRALAERAYNIAKTLDDWAGEDYSGTSVLAGAKAMQALGLIGSYRWAFGHEDVVDTLTNIGPVVLGLYWTEGMRSAAGGVMALTGANIGGHCTVAVGYDPACAALAGRPAIRVLNSWGTGWADAGLAWLAVSDLITLLQKQGEACVVAA